MAETTEIKCDQCGKDLTYTGNCQDYYLVLGSASKAPWFLKDGERGGVLTSMAIRPPVSRTHHFCGFGCLDAWRDEARARSAEAAAKRQAEREARKIHPNYGFTIPAQNVGNWGTVANTEIKNDEKSE